MRARSSLSSERKRCSVLLPVSMLTRRVCTMPRQLPGVTWSTFVTRCGWPLCMMTMPTLSWVATITGILHAPAKTAGSIDHSVGAGAAPGGHEAAGHSARDARFGANLLPPVTERSKPRGTGTAGAPPGVPRGSRQATNPYQSLFGISFGGGCVLGTRPRPAPGAPCRGSPTHRLLAAFRRTCSELPRRCRDSPARPASWLVFERRPVGCRRSRDSYGGRPTMFLRHSPRRASILAALALVLMPAIVLAAPKPKKGAADAAAGSPAPAAPDKPYADWKKTTKDAEVKHGFFTLYQKRENLYLELRPDQLDKPVLGIFSIARGIGRDFVLGGLSVFNDLMLEFHRSGDHVLVMQMNTRFTAPPGSAIEKAKDLSLGNSVIASLKVE